MMSIESMTLLSHSWCSFHWSSTARTAKNECLFAVVSSAMRGMAVRRSVEEIRQQFAQGLEPSADFN